MKLSEKLRKLEEVGIDTSKFIIKCNGLNIKLEKDDGKNEGIDLSKILVNETFSKSINGDAVKINIDVDSIHDAYIKSCDIETNSDTSYILSAKCDDKEILVNTLRMINSEDGYDSYIRHKFTYQYQWYWLEKMLKKMVDREVNVNVYSKFINRHLVLSMFNHFSKKAYQQVVGSKLNEFKKEVGDEVPYYRIKQLYSFVQDFNKTVISNTKLKPETSKCAEWSDAYRGLNGYLALVTLAKSYGIGDVEELQERLEEYVERDCLYKFIRDLIGMDLRDLYKEM